VPVSSSGREEEHLLLSHILGSARRLLTISWQRADETGRAKVPSLALREVSRVTLGSADFAAPLQAEASHRVATHPADVTRETRDGFAFIPPRDARLGAALEMGSPGRVKRAASSLAGAGDLSFRENLEPGLSLLEAVESFSPADLRYDAMVGQAAPSPSTWSPTRLETLGNCPQQYFFRYVLRVEELEEILPEHEFDLGELGRLAHRVLHQIYKRLLEEGALSRPGAEPEQAARRGMELLEDVWSAQAKPTAERLHRRYPLLWSSLSSLWKNALQTFLLHDITDLQVRGSRLLDLERAVEVEIGLDGNELLAMRGRFDRVLRDAAGRPVVGDYKTMGNLERRVDPRTILKGRALQMPLYVLMEEAEAESQGRQGAGVTAEVIGVGPAFSEGAPPGRPNPEGYPARETLSPKIFGKYRAGILETLGILIRTAVIGAFPLNSKSERCAWCPFTRACRKDHAPTLARIAGATEAAAYLSLDGKSTRVPLLAPAGPGGQGEMGGRKP
jgi:RecB family exonuclease